MTPIRPAWMPRLSFAPPAMAPRGDVLVCIFLRGAADALNIVVPHGDAHYYQLRPTLAIARPDDQRTAAHLRARDLDGYFGLHPALAPLLPAWSGGQLALVHACGAPDESRSHFQAMELIERGASSSSGPASGWLARHLTTMAREGAVPLRAVGFGERLPLALQGGVPALALRSIADFHLGGDAAAVAWMQSTLASLYSGDQGLGSNAATTLALLATLERLNNSPYQPAGGASYPESELGMGLRQTAMLIKAELGLEVACLDHGGWDTHIAQGGSEGLMAGLLTDLANSLAALYTDLADRLNQLVVVVLSEFGRRAQENGGLGTDHGHGGAMLLLGGGLAGRRVYGRWPGLASEHLAGPGDLAITTDYRDVLGEIVARRLNNPQLEAVFPGYTPQFVGLARPATS